MGLSLWRTLLLLSAAAFSANAQSGCGFGDEFNSAQLDQTKWEIFKGSPRRPMTG